LRAFERLIIYYNGYLLVICAERLVVHHPH
jgi:hypothetical protein